jgi:hypothetical protein
MVAIVMQNDRLVRQGYPFAASFNLLSGMRFTSVMKNCFIFIQHYLRHKRTLNGDPTLRYSSIYWI